MARKSMYYYDPHTGNWTRKGVPKKLELSTKEEVSKSSKDNLTASNTDKDTPTGSSEKKYNTIEYNILSGDLQFIVTKESIKLRAGDTVRLNNIGKYLSGDYYVQDVTRSISSTGYSHNATLIKTDFGDTLKSKTSDSQAKKTAKQPKTQERVHYLKKGESLWKVASIYYGNGAKYPELAKANNIAPSQYTRLPIGMKILVP